jgi:hypothetical protein
MLALLFPHRLVLRMMKGDLTSLVKAKIAADMRPDGTAEA